MTLYVCWWGKVLAACVGRVVCGNDVARGERGKVLGMALCIRSAVHYRRGCGCGGGAFLYGCGGVEACWWGKTLSSTAGVAVRCGGKCIACWGDGLAVRVWSMIRERGVRRRGGGVFLQVCRVVEAFW
ncbi:MULTISPECIES: hypothetical protein [unclassified Bartonella]|uniref:hypothetical protein n=1 Tax=unclassified Bartonella TaxID=2645622 RepID=UPI00235F6B69|nr:MULTISPECIES: hypothetical protein [unclassified Bartonella]